MTIYHADLDGTSRSRALNAVRQAAQLPWFAKNLGLKILLTLKFGKLLKLAGQPALRAGLLAERGAKRLQLVGRESE